MKIAIESKIPFIRGVLEKAAHEVTYLEPEEFTAESVRHMDALIIRTRTRCDSRLLDRSGVTHIATATIGTDHIDLDYCRSRGIKVSNAPGCNAPAVAQYVMSSIVATGRRSGVIGIVGVGHVGSIVNRWATANGFTTLLCDPPLGLDTPLDEIAAKADIITFHTPLDRTTRHMADAPFFNSLQRRPLIINAARGPIVHTDALIDAIDSGAVSAAVIDCWEGEPDIDPRLLQRAAIATPHIAGYSLQGKQRATAMAVRAIAPDIVLPMPAVSQAPGIDRICASYNPLADTAALKASPTGFERLRNNYDYRDEP